MRKLILFSILALFIFTSCDFFRSKNLFSDDAEDTLLYQLRQDSARYVDSIRTLKQDLQQVKKSHEKLLDSIKSSKVQASKGYKYHVIVGAFRNQQYLNTYNKYIQEKGFKTRVLENEYGFKMISVESYKSWQTAARALENIKNDVEPNAWIYIKG